MGFDVNEINLLVSSIDKELVNFYSVFNRTKNKMWLKKIVDLETIKLKLIRKK